MKSEKRTKIIIPVRIISASKKYGVVIIRCGPYEIRFIQNQDGQVKTMGIRLVGSILVLTSVPVRFYNLAEAKAQVIFRNWKSKIQIKIKKRTLPKETPC